MNSGEMTFVGVPIDSVGRSGGTESAPAALRDLGLALVLGIDGGDVAVHIRGEDRDPVTGIVASDDVLATTAALRSAVRSVVAGGERPFLVGGCCAELPGALAGARDVLGRTGLAYLDGHVDLYDGVTSPTGEAADMPVSVALGLGPDAWVEACGGRCVEPADLRVIGTRDLDAALADGMRDPRSVGGGQWHIDVAAVRRAGPQRVGAAAASTLAEGVGSFWLHVDLDVLDQHVFPATDYLMPGGMSWFELIDVLRPLAGSPSLVGISLACYNPDKDPGGACGRAVVDAWRAVLAR